MNPDKTKKPVTFLLFTLKQFRKKIRVANFSKLILRILDIFCGAVVPQIMASYSTKQKHTMYSRNKRVKLDISYFYQALISLRLILDSVTHEL